MNKLKNIIIELFGKKQEEEKSINTDPSLKNVFDEIRNSSAAKNERLKKTLNTIAYNKRKSRETLYKQLDSIKKNSTLNTRFSSTELPMYNQRWLHAEESDEDKVLKILKGDFEKKFGMSFEKFIEIYHKIMKNSPEKLI